MTAGSAAGWSAREILTLGGVVLLAAVLRLTGSSHGIDLHEPAVAIWNDQTDEETQAIAVRDRHLEGNFDPGPCWLWGSGGFQVYGFLDRALIPLLAATTGADDSAAALESNLSLVLLSHRIASTLAAILAIVLLARFVRKEAGSRAALLAAFFLAVAYLPVRESHYGTLDQWLLLGTAVTLDRALSISRGACLRTTLVAGAIAGVFASFKYSGAALFPLLWIGEWWGAGRPLLSARASGKVARVAGRVGASLAAGAIAYVAMSPTLFASWSEAVAMLVSQQGLIGFELSRVPEMASFHLAKSLWIGMGETLLPVAAAGLLVAAWSWPARRGVLFLLLAIATCVFPLSNTSHSVRQALPVFVPLAAGAGVLIDALATRLRLRPATIAAIALLVALPSLVRGVCLDLLLRAKDTRVEAMRLLAESGVEPTDAIGIGFYGLPRSSAVEVRSPFQDWLVAVNLRGLPRASAATMRPRFLIRDLCSGVADSFGWTDFAEIAEREYRVVLRMDGRIDRRRPELPDLEHGTPYHFIPFESPWLMGRPGPAYVVYERL